MEGHETAEARAQKVYTFHCLCTQLVLASTTPLTSLSTRTSDRTHICPLPALPTEGQEQTHLALLHHTKLDPKPFMIRLEDGFEKRYLQKCPRCSVTIGYQLDKSQYEGLENDVGRREDVIYLLPGGLMDTEEMAAGKNMEKQIELLATEA